jgi:hypothetical protein
MNRTNACGPRHSRAFLLTTADDLGGARFASAFYWSVFDWSTIDLESCQDLTIVRAYRHREYYTRELAGSRFAFGEHMPVVCQAFTRVFPPPAV